MHVEMRLPLETRCFASLKKSPHWPNLDISNSHLRREVSRLHKNHLIGQSNISHLPIQTFAYLHIRTLRAP